MLITLCLAPAGTTIASSPLILVRIPVDPDLALSPFHAEELIRALVDFLADFLSRLQRHHHQLEMLSRIKDTAVVVILFGKVFNIYNKTFHHDLPWWMGLG